MTELGVEESLKTLVFWVPIKAYEGKKGIIYEHRHSGKRIFLKYVARYKHFMRKYQAWAIDEDILADMQLLKVEQIYIYVAGEGLYMTSLENFEEHSLVDEYGHGDQSFLNEKYWQIVWSYDFWKEAMEGKK